MARPRKMDEEKRDFTIRVRVTPAEKKQLQSRCAEQGMTLSDFMRLKSMNSTPLLRKAAPERAALIKGLAELGKIGSNVNQIARALNSQNIPDTGRAIEVAVPALHGIDTLTRHLVNLLQHGH